jgi:hypothetical protein
LISSHELADKQFFEIEPRQHDVFEKTCVDQNMFKDMVVAKNMFFCHEQKMHQPLHLAFFFLHVLFSSMLTFQRELC